MSAAEPERHATWESTIHRRLISTLIVACLATVFPACIMAATVEPDDLRKGDLVDIELAQGGSVRGHALMIRAEVLHLRTEEGNVDVDLCLVDTMELIERTGEEPIPVIEALTAEEERLENRRIRTRAAGLGLASFLVPGIGQFATGQPGLGSTYLIGTLVIDLALVLTIVVNQDPVIAVLLGALDLASRISSASLASQAVRKVAIWVAPSAGADIRARGWVLGLAFRCP